jgi:hypothetical protein
MTILTYEESLQSLIGLYVEGGWLVDSLDTVLRHYEGDLDESINYIIALEGSLPADLLNSLEESSSVRAATTNNVVDLITPVKNESTSARAAATTSNFIDLITPPVKNESTTSDDKELKMKCANADPVSSSSVIDLFTSIKKEPRTSVAKRNPRKPSSTNHPAITTFFQKTKVEPKSACANRPAVVTPPSPVKVALTGKKGRLSKEEKKIRRNTLAKASRKRKMDSRTEEEAVEFRDHQRTVKNANQKLNRKLKKDSMPAKEIRILSKEEKKIRAEKCIRKNTLAKASRKRQMDSRTEEEAVEFRNHTNTLQNENRILKKDSMTAKEIRIHRDRTNTSQTASTKKRQEKMTAEEIRKLQDRKNLINKKNRAKKRAKMTPEEATKFQDAIRANARRYHSLQRTELFRQTVIERTTETGPVTSPVSSFTRKSQFHLLTEFLEIADASKFLGNPAVRMLHHLSVVSPKYLQVTNSNRRLIPRESVTEQKRIDCIPHLRGLEDQVGKYYGIWACPDIVRCISFLFSHHSSFYKAEEGFIFFDYIIAKTNDPNKHDFETFTQFKMGNGGGGVAPNHRLLCRSSHSISPEMCIKIVCGKAEGGRTSLENATWTIVRRNRDMENEVSIDLD